MRKFTAEEKHDIRCLYRNAANQNKQIKILAELYATSKNDICIVLGLESSQKAWRKSKYSPELKAAVIKAVDDGMSQAEAGRQFHLSVSVVNMWVTKARKERMCKG